jgi:acyl-CoA synthetase (AMP-forming)/AMP-acid ligase II/NAD(P)-dependent dehydrogenase (short-subunit alcohol dehydrogenase family)
MERESTVVAASSLVHGGPLPGMESWPATLGHLLLRAAREAPEARVTVVQADGREHAWSYQELARRAGGRGAALVSQGLAPGARVLLQLARPEHFLEAFWGCVLHGLVPVPLPAADDFADGGPAATKLWHAWHQLDQPTVLVDALTEAGVRASARSRGLAGLRCMPIESLTGELSPTFVPRGQSDDVTLLLLTSGSTGASKAVRLTHRNLMAMNAGTARLKQLGAADTTLNWMPLDHVGALVFLGTMAVFMGASQVHVATSYVLADPLRWLELLSRHRVAVSWAPNFAFGLINELTPALARARYDLSSLRCLANGGEAVVPATALRFLDLLAPHGLRRDALQPAFGMSETSSVITWADGLAHGLASSSAHANVGPPIPGAWLRITDVAERVLAEGEIGRLQVKGPAIFQGYEGDPEATRRALRADGWFDTGDLGFVAHGRLTITGREKDTIIVNGRNYFNHEIEAVAEAVPGVAVSFVGACAVRRAGQDSEELAVFFSPEDDNLNTAAGLCEPLRLQVAQRVGLHAAHVVALRKQEFPKTGIGKIQRSELRRRFESGDYAERLAAAQAETARVPGQLPDAFYRRVFRRKRGVSRGTRRPAGTTVVLLDAAGIGAAFTRQLEQRGWPVQALEVSLAADQGDARPAEPADYANLQAHLAARGLPACSDVVCVWPCDLPHQAAARALVAPAGAAVAHLLALLNGLPGPDQGEGTLRLWLATCGAQAVEPTEAPTPAAAPLVALALSASLEQPCWLTRSVDLTPGHAPQASAAELWTEFQSLTHDDEVAYRHGERWVPRLVPLTWRRALAAPPALKSDALCLVTGGLGGVGLHVCADLLARHAARLLIVGRRSAQDPNVSTLLARLDPGAERVRYASLDLADEAALRAAVESARAHWGAGLQAVFHLAGDAEERLLVDTGRADWERAARAKLHGTAALHALVERERPALFVAFSSVHSLLGGFQVGTYAAAGRGLDALTAHIGQLPGVRSLLVHWTRWHGVGMGAWASGEQQARAQGLRTLAVEEGLAALLLALAQPHPSVLTALEPRGALRRHVEGLAAPLWRLAYSGTAQPERELLALAGSAGLSAELLSCEHLPVLPRTADGRIDRARLAAGHTARTAASDVPPRTPTEVRLLALWREVLQAEAVGVLDKFFEVGGSSLKSVRLLAGIQERFQCRLSVGDLFTHNTVRAQAARVDACLALDGVQGATAAGEVETHEF